MRRMAFAEGNDDCAMSVLPLYTFYAVWQRSPSANAAGIFSYNLSWSKTDETNTFLFRGGCCRLFSFRMR